jgi:peptidyl-prolyl cis-trans isomerase B (cyclophilin B)
MAGEDPKDDQATEQPKEEPNDPVALKPLKEAPTDGDEVAVLETAKGTIVVMFYPDRAPNHVKNFIELAKSGFYDGTRFHRTIRGFMIQGGDPSSKDIDASATWGMGGNVVDGVEKTLEAEFNDIDHKAGVLSMARSGSPDSASSQFYIVHEDSPHLNFQYTAFGKVVSGMEVVDEIADTPVKDDNGTVYPKYAVVLKKVTIKTWPLDETKKD